MTYFILASDFDKLLIIRSRKTGSDNKWKKKLNHNMHLPFLKKGTKETTAFCFFNTKLVNIWCWLLAGTVQAGPHGVLQERLCGRLPRQVSIPNPIRINAKFQINTYTRKGISEILGKIVKFPIGYQHLVFFVYFVVSRLFWVFLKFITSIQNEWLIW